MKILFSFLFFLLTISVSGITVKASTIDEIKVSFESFVNYGVVSFEGNQLSIDNEKLLYLFPDIEKVNFRFDTDVFSGNIEDRLSSITLVFETYEELVEPHVFYEPIVPFSTWWYSFSGTQITTTQPLQRLFVSRQRQGNFYEGTLELIEATWRPAVQNWIVLYEGWLHRIHR